MKRSYTKIILLMFFILSILLVWKYNLLNYLTLNQLKTHQLNLIEFYRNHLVYTTFLYFLIYIFTTALSLPGAVILTLAGGAIFGVFYGTILISFASTIGATLSFLSSRFLLSDIIEKRFKKYSDKINKGMKENGAFYLLTLRLIPVFPFFIINLVMGLTKIPVMRFFFISQIGMLPGTIIYVNAGHQLSKIDTIESILSVNLLLSLILLGLFPLVVKWAINQSQIKKVIK